MTEQPKSTSPLANVPGAVARRGTGGKFAPKQPAAEPERDTETAAYDMDTGSVKASPEDQEALRKRIAEIRANRTKLGGRRGRLDYEVRPGFQRRWVNHLINGRVNEFLRRGWAIVHDEKNKPVERGVGVLAEGGKLEGYLMEIPQEIYDEDFAAKQEIQDRKDEAVYSGTLNEEKGDNRYVPRGIMNFRVGNRMMPKK